jgi:hypothetical protein
LPPPLLRVLQVLLLDKKLVAVQVVLLVLLLVQDWAPMPQVPAHKPALLAL